MHHKGVVTTSNNSLRSKFNNFSYSLEEGKHNNLYAITSVCEQEDSRDVVTSNIQIFSFDLFPKTPIHPFGVFKSVENFILA